MDKCGGCANWFICGGVSLNNTFYFPNQFLRPHFSKSSSWNSSTPVINVNMMDLTEYFTKSMTNQSDFPARSSFKDQASTVNSFQLFQLVFVFKMCFILLQKLDLLVIKSHAWNVKLFFEIFHLHILNENKFHLGSNSCNNFPGIFSKKWTADLM